MNYPDIPAAHQRGFVATPGTLRHYIDQRIATEKRLSTESERAGNRWEDDPHFALFADLCKKRSRILMRRTS